MSKSAKAKPPKGATTMGSDGSIIIEQLVTPPSRTKKLRGINRMFADPSYCRTGDGMIQVTVSGESLAIVGFPEPPRVLAAWHDQLPAEIPLDPTNGSAGGLSGVNQVQAAGVNWAWGPITYEYTDPCPTDFSGNLLIYLRYDNFHDVYTLIQTIPLSAACGDIGACPP